MEQKHRITIRIVEALSATVWIWLAFPHARVKFEAGFFVLGLFAWAYFMDVREFGGLSHDR